MNAINTIEYENTSKKPANTGTNTTSLLQPKEVKYCGWLKQSKKTSLPKFSRASIHYLSDGNLIICGTINNKLSFYIYHAPSQKVQELATYSTEEHFQTDAEFISMLTFLVNARLVYLIKNGLPNDDHHVYFFDIQTKKLFPIKNDETRPSTFRINYSASLFDVKIYIFGGLNMQLEPLDLLETYNITTYKWEVVQTKGKSPSPRHSHSTIISGSNLYVIGGTKAKDIFSREGNFDDVYMLNLQTITWTPVKTFGNSPKYLAYHQTFQIMDKYVLFMWCDKSKDNFEAQVSKLDLEKYEWRDVAVMGKSSEFRFGAGYCLDEKSSVGYLYGGIYLSKNESACNAGDFDRILFSENRQGFDNHETMDNDKNIVENASKVAVEKSLNEIITNENPDIDNDIEDEDISFEELLEREKKLLAEERNKVEEKKTKKKKQKKKEKKAAEKGKK